MDTERFITKPWSCSIIYNILITTLHHIHTNKDISVSVLQDFQSALQQSLESQMEFVSITLPYCRESEALLSTVHNLGVRISVGVICVATCYVPIRVFLVYSVPAIIALTPPPPFLYTYIL